MRAALLRHQATIGDDWAAFDEPLAGHRYRAMRVVADSLDAINPFILLADRVLGAKKAMGRQTLVVIGADFGPNRPGFVILNDQVNGWGLGDPEADDRANGEELQDHACALARL